ncbi:MAG: DUF2961 domain-containing protein [Blautia wexlerae]
MTDVKGKGHYVGTYIALTTLERYWWGEGEMKFYIDGDDRISHNLRNRNRRLFLEAPGVLQSRWTERQWNKIIIHHIWATHTILLMMS